MAWYGWLIIGAETLLLVWWGLRDLLKQAPSPVSAPPPVPATQPHPGPEEAQRRAERDRQIVKDSAEDPDPGGGL